MGLYDRDEALGANPSKGYEEFDGGIRHSQVLNEGYQKDNAGLIRDEIRRREKRRKASGTSATDVRNWASDTGALIKQVNGGFEHQSDEQGRLLYKPSRSDIFQNPDGKFVRTYRDRYGVEREDSADRDVEWKIGDNGKLIKDNKYNAPEEMDAEEAYRSGNDDMRKLGREALYRRAISDAKKKYDDLGYELKNPELQKSKLSKKDFDIFAEDPDSLLDEDRSRYDATVSILEKEKQRYEAEGLKRRLESMTPEQWEQYSQDEEDKRFRGLSQEEFNREMKSRGDSLNARKLALQEAHSAKSAEFQKRIKELEADDEEFRENAKLGLYAEEIDFYHEAKAIREREKVRLQQEIDKWNAQSSEEKKAFERDSARFNGFQSARNATNQQLERQRVDRGISDLDNRQEEMGIDEESLPEGSAAFAQARDALRSGDNESYNQALQSIAKAETDQSEKWTNYRDELESVYTILEDYYTPEALAQVGGMDYSTVKSTIHTVGSFGTLKSAGKTKSEGGIYEKDALTRIKAMFPGEISDDEVQKLAYKAIRANKWEGSSETARVLDSGEVVINPSAVWKKDAQEIDIGGLNASRYAKYKAREIAENIRKATLDMKIVDMGNYSRPFNNFVKENDYDLSSDEGKMEALTEFAKQQPGFFTQTWREFSNALRGGAASASTAIVGGAGFAAGFVTRNQGLMSASADLMEAGASGARDLAGVTAMEGSNPDSWTYAITSAAPSLAPVGIASTAGRGIGALAQGLSTNAIKGGGKAAIRKFVAKNAPKAGIYAGGGLQSYGGMLSDTYLELKEKHGEADAKRMLNSGEGQWEAVVGGLATMATMKLFPEGKEAVFRGKDLSSSSLRSLARDAGGAKAALSAIKSSPEMRKDIAVFLKETIGKGIKDEALQEASDQLIQGLAANYDSQEKNLGEIIAESLEAGVIGGILGGAVTGGASAFGKGQDFDTRIANIRSQTFNEIGQTSAEDKAANINAALSSEGVEITPDSIKEIESLTGEYGLGMRHNQLAVRITEQEQTLAQARESGDYSASRKIEEEISDLTSQHKQLAQEDLAQGARAWNDIKTQRENANEAFKTAQEAQQEAVESNDQAAEQSASEALQEAQAQLQQADIASAIVKIAGGQNAEALTKAEVNALGVVREDGQLRLMTNEELEEAGLPASSIDIVGDALVITDDALASVEFLSPAAREYVTLDETQQRQVAARMAEEAAQAAEAEQALDKQPTTDEQEAPEAGGEGQPLAQDEQQAAQTQTWTGSTEGGTQLSVEATSQEEAKKLLAIEADKTNEFLDSDSVQQASESGGVGLEQQQDSGAGINETSAPDSTIDQPTPPTVTNPNHRKHIGQYIQQSTNEQANPVLSKLTPIVERVAPHFKNVTYTELPAETSGFAYDGNQLLVDLDKVIDNYGAGTDEEVTQFLRAAVVEEVIHKASTDTYQRPEAEETWSQIPDDIKQHVTETYYAAQVQATGQAPEMDSYTGFHEFVRMVIQSDEKVLGFISELPSQNAKLSERIAQIFKTILDVLSGVEENIPEVKIATARVREQMKAMGVMDADGNLTLYETPRNTASGEAFNQSNNQQIPQTDTGEVPTGDPGQAEQGSGELPTGADGQPQGLKNTGEIAELVDDRVKGRKSEKIRPSDLFEPSKIADDPLIAYIRDSIGGLESKTRQKKRLGNNKNNAEFDGSSALTPATNKEIYSGNVRAGEAANMLYEEGLINENSEDAMWEAIASAQNSIVSNNKAGIQQAKGEAAKANLRIDFEKRAFKKTKNAIEKDPSELLAGDKLTIKGAEFSVENVVTDEDGRAIEVVLDGGEKFGKQTLNADERIYVDSYTERQESGFLGGEESSAEQTTPRLGQGENQGDLLDSTGTDPGLSLQQETYTEPEAEEDTRTQDEIDADAGQSTMFGGQNLENPTSDSGITRSEKQPLPDGKVSVRWNQGRGVYQLYVGGKYVDAVSGNNMDEVVEQLDSYYDYDKSRLEGVTTGKSEPSEANIPPADNPAAPEPLSAGEQALRDAFGSFDENLLGSSERVTSEDDSQKYNKPLPPAAMPNFIQAAQMLVSEGKTKPADIAAMIDKVTNKKARPYINAVYRMMQAVDTSLQSEVEWNNVYDAIDNPPEVGIKTQAVQGIVNQVNQNLQDNNPIDKKALKDQFDPDNTLSKKEHDEVIETAVTDFVHKQMETSDDLLGQAYDKLVEVLGNQPALTAKTSQSKINQAYSTPAPLALTASRIANIADGNVILEPTAGHGMLLGETTSQQTVYYNEIDPARVARTQENIAKAENWNVTSEDATPLTIPEQADRIIANPPFGTLMQEDGSNAIFKTAAGETTQIDHAIVLQSLENMTDDGRAVFIIGGAAKTAQSEDARKAHYQSGAKGRVFNHLYDT